LEALETLDSGFLELLERLFAEEDDDFTTIKLEEDETDDFGSTVL